MQVPTGILESRRQEQQLARFEGLIFKTAQLTVGAGVELEFEDVQQLLRVKAWKAVRDYSPERAHGLTLERYVFMCVFDQRKTIENKKKRYECHIEDAAPAGGDEELIDAFHERYLSVDHQDVYGDIDDELPFLPNTLVTRERWVLTLLMRNYRQVEIAEALQITKRDVENAVRQLRSKLGDWRPAAPAALVAA